jgi:hypothetical protein
MKTFAMTCLALIACGGSDDGEKPTNPDATLSIDAPKSIDAPAQTFPAVCQKFPLSCPNASALAACEAGSGTAFSLCTYLPITTGCATAGCPSGAQICRTAETAIGYCTHACVTNNDCPIAGGGLGTCTTINGTVKICVVN